MFNSWAIVTSSPALNNCYFLGSLKQHSVQYKCSFSSDDTNVIFKTPNYITPLSKQKVKDIWQI